MHAYFHFFQKIFFICCIAVIIGIVVVVGRRFTNGFLFNVYNCSLYFQCPYRKDKWTNHAFGCNWPIAK